MLIEPTSVQCSEALVTAMHVALGSRNGWQHGSTQGRRLEGFLGLCKQLKRGKSEGGF